MAVHHLHRADLRDAVPGLVQTGGLDVKAHEIRVQRQVRVPLNGQQVVHVVDVVALQAVDDLDARLLAFDPQVREGLGHPMVGDGHGLVAPAGGGLHRGGGVRQGVQAGKAGM